MTGRVQTLRSNVSGNRPVGHQPGELYVNWADNQFGVVNSANAAQDLIAVRYFSTAANYVIGDFVIQGGQLYRAVAASAPGTFVPANWSQIGGSVGIGVNPPGNPQPGTLWWDTTGGQLYVWYDDGDTKQWVVAVNLASALSPATTTALGGVKVDGTSISASADGTISTVLTPIGDNRIINGDMRIDQRNNGAAAPAPGYTVDRWNYSAAQTGKVVFQRQGPASAGSGLQAAGFGYALGATTSAAYVAAAGEAFCFSQAIEADLIADFLWGTPAAQPVTLSFWVNASAAGTYSGAIRNAPVPSTRSYPFQFTVNGPGWVKIIITIPGDTAGTWVMAGNAVGLYLLFDLGSGATYRGPAGAWASANYVGANGSVSPINTLSAFLQITGVKLEIGTVATPFNRQSLAKSMVDCQRYYQQGQIAVAGFNSNVGANAYTSAYFQTTMRAGPTIATITNNNNNFTFTSWGGLALGANGVTAIGVNAGAAGPMTINMTFSASAEL